MTIELTMDSAMESKYAQLGLEAGFVDTLKDIFTLGREKRAYADVKTFNTLKERDIHTAGRAIVKYLDSKGYMDVRVLRLTKPVEINKPYPEVLDAITKVLMTTDEEFIQLYVAPLRRLLGTLVNNTSKLSSMSPVVINKTYDFQATQKAHDILFESYKVCLDKQGNPVSTFGELYPNSSAFIGFGNTLRGYYGQINNFNIGKTNDAINEVFDLLNDLYTTIKSDKKVKLSKAVAKQIQDMTILMSAAGDLYVTTAQQYRVLASSHNEHLVRMEEYAKRA